MSINAKDLLLHHSEPGKDDQVRKRDKEAIAGRFGVQKRKNDGRPLGRQRGDAVSAFYGGIKVLLNDARKVLLPHLYLWPRR